MSAALSSTVIPVLGLTLVHFLWQGAALAAAFAVGRRLLRHRSPGTRYLLGAATLALMLVAPVLTAGVLLHGDPIVSPSGWMARDRAVGSPAAGGVGISPSSDRTPSRSATGAGGGIAGSPDAGEALDARPGATEAPHGGRWPALVVLLWMTGVGLSSIRLVGGFVLVRAQARRAREAVPAELRERFGALRRAVGVTGRVDLAISASVSAPMVVGILRPVVLLPMSAVTGLRPLQLEAILAHELAHVRRHDPLVNVLQAAVETVLFYHPAVWWVSAVVRRDREEACDDVAVDATEIRAADYARALLTLAEAHATAAAPAAAATGSGLAGRVRRLLGRSPGGRMGTADALGAAGALLLATLSMGILTATDAATGEGDDPASGADAVFADFEPMSSSVMRTLERGPWRRHDSGDHTRIEYERRGGWECQVESDGRLLFARDGRSVEWMDAGASLEIEERDRDGVARLAVFEAGDDGTPEVTFEVRDRGDRWREVSDHEAGMRWVAPFLESLQAMGLDATERARRLMREDGPRAVVDAAREVESDGTKARFFRGAASVDGVSSEDLAVLIEGAGRTVESDGTLSSLLRHLSADAAHDEVVADALWSACRDIESDGTMASLLTDLLEDEIIDAPRALELGASWIESDGTLASLIDAVAHLSGPGALGDVLDRSSPLARALASIESDGTLSSSLVRLVRRGLLPADAALEVARDEIGSDGTLAATIDEMADDASPRAVEDALHAIGSDGTLGSLLVELHRRGTLDAATTLAIGADRIGSDGSLGTVVRRVLDPPSRPTREEVLDLHDRVDELLDDRGDRRRVHEILDRIL